MTTATPAHRTDAQGDLWARLAAPLPPTAIKWRQSGKPFQRNGKFFAQFVAFIDAVFVRERLDGIVPGEWDVTLEKLPDGATSDGEERFAFKARLQVLNVIREGVGTGKDYKQAATDALKRAAVLYGIGSELYAMKGNVVEIDSDSKYAKPLEDPAVAYARRAGQPAAPPRQVARPPAMEERDPDPGQPFVTADEADEVTPRSPVSDDPPCPKCGGRMWDNRAGKRNPKAPDYKCRDRSCDGVVWPKKGSKPAPTPKAEDDDEDSPRRRQPDDSLPF